MADMYIDFNCANCGASLKVMKTFGGKTIQCPKCTKKTAVPAADGSAASSAPKAPAAAARPAVPPPPASAEKPAAADGVSIAFACANCSAALKVMKSFAGKTIQCPKCAKKTLVPGSEVKEEPAPVKGPAAPTPAPVPREEMPVPSAPAVPSPAPVPGLQSRMEVPAALKTPVAPAPVPVPAPAAPAPTPAPVAAEPSPELLARLGGQEERMAALGRQLKDMELKLDVERLKAERAEREKQELAARKETDRARLQEELSVHFKAEADAAKLAITRLEQQVRLANEQRLAAGGARTAAQIQKELLSSPEDALMEAETAVPDAVLAPIRDIRFGRYLRTAILVHIVLLAVTSVGTIRAYFAPPPEEGEGAEGTNTVAAVSAPVAVAPSGNAESNTSAPASTPAAPAAAEAVKPAPAAVPAAAPAAVPATEALPAPGEKPPTDTAVDLGLR